MCWKFMQLQHWTIDSLYHARKGWRIFEATARDQTDDCGVRVQLAASPCAQCAGQRDGSRRLAENAFFTCQKRLRLPGFRIGNHIARSARTSARGECFMPVDHVCDLQSADLRRTGHLDRAVSAFTQ